MPMCFDLLSRRVIGDLCLHAKLMRDFQIAVADLPKGDLAGY